MGRQFRELSVERRVNADGERAKPQKGELMNRAIPFHLFSCVCSVKFLRAISAVVQRHTQMHHFSLRLWSPNVPLRSGRKKAGDHHLNKDHGNTVTAIASPTPRQKQSTIILLL